MRLLSKRQVRQLVLYSNAHIDRLEKQGLFPQRLRLGNGPRCRVGWLAGEIEEWVRERIERRARPTDSFP